MNDEESDVIDEEDEPSDSESLMADLDLKGEAGISFVETRSVGSSGLALLGSSGGRKECLRHSSDMIAGIIPPLTLKSR